MRLATGAKDVHFEPGTIHSDPNREQLAWVAQDNDKRIHCICTRQDFSMQFIYFSQARTWGDLWRFARLYKNTEIRQVPRNTGLFPHSLGLCLRI
jgi:hypothetical protein